MQVLHLYIDIMEPLLSGQFGIYVPLSKKYLQLRIQF